MLHYSDTMFYVSVTSNCLNVKLQSHTVLRICNIKLLECSHTLFYVYVSITESSDSTEKKSRKHNFLFHFSNAAVTLKCDQSHQNWYEKATPSKATSHHPEFERSHSVKKLSMLKLLQSPEMHPSKAS